jgi:hypothetical protein
VSGARSQDTPYRLSPQQLRLLLAAGCDLAGAWVELARHVDGANISSMTSEGSAQGPLQRVCESGNLARAEIAVQELGYVSLPNALRLVCLYAAVDYEKLERASRS